LQVPIEITARNIRMTESLDEMIRERANGLERFYPRLVRCHVTLEGPGNHHKSGGLYDVRIDLRVPGKEIVVSHQAGEDLAVSVRDAFDAARRQVQDYAEKQRGETKNHEGVPEGLVSKLFGESGYGFIQTADGREVYFHENSVQGGGFASLELGRRVRFSEEPGVNGPQAAVVTAVD
jgi:ribosomal subunit interface protein